MCVLEPFCYCCTLQHAVLESLIASFLNQHAQVDRKGRSQWVVVNGEYGDPTTFISGVLHGSVIGPLLFLRYINDISQNLTSTVRLYADDTLIYHTICIKQDVIGLQNYLNTVV